MKRVISISIFFYFAFIFTACEKDNNTNNTIDLTDGLVAHYTFDNNNIADAIGTQHGTNTGATFSTNSFNNSGRSLSFSGNDNNQIAFVEDSLLDQSKNLSISFWFYLNSVSQASYTNLVSSRHDSIGQEQGGIDISIKQDSTLMIVGRKISPLTNLIIVDSTSKINISQWNHICVTLTDAGTLSLYLNNQLISSETNSSGEIRTSPFWAFGAIFTPTANIIREMNGNLDDIRFYNKVLSSEEITSVYNKN